MDHAQLHCDAPTAALQQSSAMHRYRWPGGLPARLLQNLAARHSQTWCKGLRLNPKLQVGVHNSAPGQCLLTYKDSHPRLARAADFTRRDFCEERRSFQRERGLVYCWSTKSRKRPSPKAQHFVRTSEMYCHPSRFWVAKSCVSMTFLFRSSHYA